jgi:polyhydroxybutyrate depolymerase
VARRDVRRLGRRAGPFLAFLLVALAAASAPLPLRPPARGASRTLAATHPGRAVPGTKIAHRSGHGSWHLRAPVGVEPSPSPYVGAGVPEFPRGTAGLSPPPLPAGVPEFPRGTAGLSPPPLPAGVTEVTTTVRVGELERAYVVYQPAKGPSPKAPVLVVLQGNGTPLWLEVSRDGLLPLAASGKAILVYPEGYLRSWNAGVCCGPAQVADVNDVGFLTQVIDHFAASRTVFLAGFSNGGRMAYRMVCTDPRLVRAFVVVDAVPSIACSPGRAVSLLQIDGSRDPIVAYDASMPAHVVGRFLEPTATGAVAAWSRRDGCSTQVTSRSMGALELLAWLNCANRTAVQFATYDGLGHAWPDGDLTTPSAADLLWAFVTDPTSVPAPGAFPPKI